MNHHFLFAAANLGDTAREVAEQFGMDWPHFIAQCVSFLIVADKMRQELANAQAKSQEILNQAGTQAAKMIEEARAAAARVQEQETQKAIAAAKDIVEKARQATEAEHARMLAELRREVGRLVVLTTGKVTGKVLTPQDQQRLADDTNRELAA